MVYSRYLLLMGFSWAFGFSPKVAGAQPPLPAAGNQASFPAPMLSPKRPQEPDWSQKTVVSEGMISCKIKDKRMRDDALKVFLQTAKDHPELDILMAPEWYLFKKDGMYSTAEFHLVRKLLEMS